MPSKRQRKSSTATSAANAQALASKQNFHFFDFNEGLVEIYADWSELGGPIHIGDLRVIKGPNQYSHYMDLNLDGQKLLGNLRAEIDPEIKASRGPQYTKHSLFGCMEDSSPDRWGRTLMKRFYERRQKALIAQSTLKQPVRGAAAVHLNSAQYLLGVHDIFRMGALRYKIKGRPEFLDSHDDQKWAIPSMMSLAELAAAAAKVEDDTIDIGDEEYEYLRLLLCPGGSLGGARPKASVVNDEGQLCIAKFPSNKDEYDKAAWESVAATLAAFCEIQTANHRIIKLNHEHHTFISERFDRIGQAQRIHFASAMSLSGLTDGNANQEAGVSYYEVLEILRKNGSQTKADARELWKRIVFSIFIKNTDDHMRNHGFILEPGKGWRLSPAYDINPEPQGTGLQLNISENDNALDLDLALSVCEDYHWSLEDAKKEIEFMGEVIVQWPNLAKKLGISSREQDRMAVALNSQFDV